MKNLINGEKKDSITGKIIEVTNPATNEFIDSVPASNEQDVDEVVTYAKNTTS